MGPTQTPPRLVSIPYTQSLVTGYYVEGGHAQVPWTQCTVPTSTTNAPLTRKVIAAPRDRLPTTEQATCTALDYSGVTSRSVLKLFGQPPPPPPQTKRGTQHSSRLRRRGCLLFAPLCTLCMPLRPIVLLACDPPPPSLAPPALCSLFSPGLDGSPPPCDYLRVDMRRVRIRSRNTQQVLN